MGYLLLFPVYLRYTFVQPLPFLALYQHSSFLFVSTFFSAFYLSFFLSPLTSSLPPSHFFQFPPKAFSKQSKQKSTNKTFQMFTKQAIPTEHFNNFHDSTACVCHLLLPFVKLAYLDTLSAKFNIFALWVIQF